MPFVAAYTTAALRNRPVKHRLPYRQFLFLYLSLHPYRLKHLPYLFYYPFPVSHYTTLFQFFKKQYFPYQMRPAECITAPLIR
jgi:hypothetical protein